MSRSGYSDDGDYEMWDQIRWRGAVASALRGRRGQAFLREMLAALYALPEKRLIQGELVDEYDDGAVCVFGAVGRVRKIAMEGVDPEDYGRVAKLFDVPGAFAREVMEVNDCRRETPEARWLRVRHWLVDHIRDQAP